MNLPPSSSLMKWLKGISAVDIADALEESVDKINAIISELENV